MGWQAPFTHAFPAGHALPQAPQLLVLLSVLVQVPLQQVVPGAVPQLLPQAPQLLVLLSVLVQVPLQQVVPSAVPQSLPQAPQFLTSVVRLVHCGCWGPVQPVAGQELGPTAGHLQ
jgi:hypothetical protein